MKPVLRYRTNPAVGLARLAKEGVSIAMLVDSNILFGGTNYSMGLERLKETTPKGMDANYSHALSAYAATLISEAIGGNLPKHIAVVVPDFIVNEALHSLEGTGLSGEKESLENRLAESFENKTSQIFELITPFKGRTPKYDSWQSALRNELNKVQREFVGIAGADMPQQIHDAALYMTAARFARETETDVLPVIVSNDFKAFMPLKNRLIAANRGLIRINICSADFFFKQYVFPQHQQQ